MVKLNTLLWVSMLVPFQLSANYVVNAVAANWVGYTDNDGSGVYWQVLKEVYPTIPLNLNVEPYLKAKIAFTQGKADILIGSYREEVDAYLLPTWHLDVEAPVLGIFNSSKTKFKNISDVKDLRLAWIKGYDFYQFLPDPLSVYEVSRSVTGFKMLMNDRIDAFIGYKDNIPDSHAASLSTIELLPKKRIWVVFQNSLEGEGLAKKFDTGMERLRKSGRLKELYGERYVLAGFEHLQP